MSRALFTALGVALTAVPAAAQVTHTVIAATGTTAAPATGTAAPGGGTYTRFNGRGPAVNAAGQFAFFGGTTGGGSGVFRHTTTAGTAVVRNAAAAPTAGFTFEGFDTGTTVFAPALNAGGDVAFYASVGNGSDSFAGVFRYAGGTGTTIALQGAAAPGGGSYGDEFGSDSIRLGNGGQVGYLTSLANTTNPDYGLFRYSGTAAASVARDGGAAPGGGTFEGLGSPTTSSAGLVTFNASFAGGGEGLFRNDGTATVAIARSGQAAPGGGTYAGFQGFPPEANASGQVAFRAAMNSVDNGVFRFDGTATVAIARTGQTVPGVPLGIGTIASTPQINTAGQVAFHAYLDVSTTNQAVYRGDGTTLTPIAVTGMTAPGTTVTFREMSFDSVKMNDQGEVAFRGQLTGTGVTTANDRGLWAGTSLSTLTLIAREGDVLFVNGANRTLAEPSASFALTDDGVAWRATFTDGTQAILYSTFTPVPEPAVGFGLAAAVLGGVVALRRRVAQSTAGSGGAGQRPLPSDRSRTAFGRVTVGG